MRNSLDKTKIFNMSTKYLMPLAYVFPSSVYDVIRRNNYNHLDE